MFSRPENRIAVVTHGGFFGMGIGYHIMQDAPEAEKETVKKLLRLDNAGVRTCELWKDSCGEVHISLVNAG